MVDRLVGQLVGSCFFGGVISRMVSWEVGPSVDRLSSRLSEQGVGQLGDSFVG
jgi:hypothetical protein